MTHDEIDKMEAGLEMDVLVAEQVMGWPKNEMRVFTTDPTHREPASGSSAWPLEYSTDIASAWEVVEKMLQMGFAYSLWGVPSVSSVCVPTVAFKCGCFPPERTVRDDRTVVAVGPVPLAICRAALKAAMFSAPAGTASTATHAHPAE